MMIRKFVGTALLLALIWPPAGASEEETQPQPVASAGVGEEKAQSQPVAVRTYKDWVLQCSENAPCLLIQRVFLRGNHRETTAEFRPVVYR